MRLLVAGFLVLAAAPAAARGTAVDGDGNVTAQKRDVPAFDAVRLETFLDVVVKGGAGGSDHISARITPSAVHALLITGVL